jgi:hypothetical protein
VECAEIARQSEWNLDPLDPPRQPTSCGRVSFCDASYGDPLRIFSVEELHSFTVLHEVHKNERFKGIDSMDDEVKEERALLYTFMAYGIISRSIRNSLGPLLLSLGPATSQVGTSVDAPDPPGGRSHRSHRSPYGPGSPFHPLIYHVPNFSLQFEGIPMF